MDGRRQSEYPLEEVTHFNDAFEDNELADILPYDAPRQYYADGISIISERQTNDYHTWSRQMMQELPSRNRADLRMRAAVSRQPSSETIRPRRLPRRTDSSVRFATLGCHGDVEAIVAEMCQDENLMGDDAAAEQMRIEALRQMPKSLSLKRCLRTCLSREASQRSVKKLSYWKRLKYNMSFKLSRMRLTISDLLFSLEIWRGSLKTIEGHFGSGIGTYFRFLRWLFLLNLSTMFLMLGFVVVPQALFWAHGGDVGKIPSFNTLDLITAEGIMNHSLLFYGFYTNQTIEIFSELTYIMPQAYLFTVVMALLLAMVVLAHSVSREYRHNYTSGSGANVAFSSKVFCGWDFSISEEGAAQLKHRSIHNELIELLEPWKEIRPRRTPFQWLLALVVQGAVHVVVVALLVGSGLLMWFLLHGNLSTGTGHPFLRDVRLALLVTALLLFLPMLFSWLVQWEDYHSHRIEIYVTVFRTFILEVVVVGVLVTFWLWQANEVTHSGQCWETALGQELYRLVLLDLLANFVVFIAEWLRKCLYQRPGARFHFLGAPEFDAARSTLGLLYSQGLVWVGLFVSPLLPLVLAIKLFLTFYMKKTSLLRNCRFSTRPWRAAQAQTVFLALALVVLLTTFTCLGYIFTQVQSSTTCGPFRDYANGYGLLLDILASWHAHQHFLAFLAFLVKPGVVATVIIAVCAVVYWLRSLAKAQCDMVGMLQEMLQMEAKDRQFLLHTIYRFFQMAELSQEGLQVSPRKKKIPPKTL